MWLNHMESKKDSWMTDECVCKFVVFVGSNAKKLLILPLQLPFVDRRRAGGPRKCWVHQVQLNIQTATRKITKLQNNINPGSVYK